VRENSARQLRWLPDRLARSRFEGALTHPECLPMRERTKWYGRSERDGTGALAVIVPEWGTLLSFRTLFSVAARLSPFASELL
jgi:hypothetical protein